MWSKYQRINKLYYKILNLLTLEIDNEIALSEYLIKNAWTSVLSEPKIPNSLALLSVPIDSIQKKSEILSDIVTEFNDKDHGSQSHISANNTIQLIV
jgi:hypothetical protein